MELLIAVAIVAVLAGIGIPVYMGLQGRTKAAEATANLDGIATCLEAYRLQHGTYIDCGASPRAATAVDQNQTAWAAAVAGAGFDLLGFDTSKPVRFSYAVGGATNLVFYAGAMGDTDGDGNGVLYVASNTEGPRVVTAADAATAVAALQGATAFNDITVVLETATVD